MKLQPEKPKSSKIRNILLALLSLLVLVGAGFGIKSCMDSSMNSSMDSLETLRRDSIRIANAKAEQERIARERAEAERVYKVGDYYNRNGKQGVVFYVDSSGRHGKIVSLNCSSYLKWCSDENEYRIRIGASSETDGAYNMRKIKARLNWRSNYPAAAWCAQLGSDWYLPALDELKTIYNQKSTLDKTLSKKGMAIKVGFNWSSTESSSHKFCAWDVGMSNGRTDYDVKSSYYCVRAVSAF